ncbi:hypothetical protein F9K07_26385 [Hydrogenophaga sp. BPS33]|nr:hypothetical protein F9K07_26385 [Hydrogenophaga sp. BPS33]
MICAAVLVLQPKRDTADKPGASGSLRWVHTHAKETVVNTIIYIVGLVVVIGIILSFFGLR